MAAFDRAATGGQHGEKREDEQNGGISAETMLHSITPRVGQSWQPAH
jgi:hypothetical protein